MQEILPDYIASLEEDGKFQPVVNVNYHTRYFFNPYKWLVVQQYKTQMHEVVSYKFPTNVLRITF